MSEIETNKKVIPGSDIKMSQRDTIAENVDEATRIEETLCCIHFNIQLCLLFAYLFT